ncbi:hypothetical protein CspeluHIS016_0403140 [Cutaneotrichosporon spelunceum]|uniref:Uncharacterized protein n=1 Tax=Cutaneotrichosporon spelunceum TaxID=1672016 RepID=A0AAD3TV72_9TREE|nr:hypothetical protein CspeluHIS016_0403140 [Cutaneotrichosporon spelunceum]
MIAPLVVAAVIAVIVIYFLFGSRRMKAASVPTITSAEQLATPLTDNVAPAPRRRGRGLNLSGGLGRSESGRSIRTLPRYTTEAGDEERVLLRRDHSLSSVGHGHERRRSDMSGLSIVSEGSTGDETPHYWGDAPSYDLGYEYGFGDHYEPPNEPPPASVHVVPSGAELPAMRSLSTVTTSSNPPSTSPSTETASSTARASLPPLTIPPPGTPPPASSATVVGPSFSVTPRSALSTPTRRTPAHSTPPPARSASYAASHRPVSASRQGPVRAASAPPIPPSRAGALRAHEALGQVVQEEVEEPQVALEESRHETVPVPPPSDQNSPTPTSSVTGLTAPEPGTWTRLRRLSPW